MAKAGALLGRRVVVEAGLDPPHGERGQRERRAADRGDDLEQPAGRVGVEHRADRPGGERDAEDHHQPGDGGRRRASVGVGGGGEQREQRGARGPDADADQHIGEDRDGEAEREARLDRDHAEGRGEAAEGEDAHAANDPGRAGAAGVGAVAPVRAGELDHVVDRHQRAGQHRGERKLDDHDAVQRGGGEHDDGADRHLDETEAEDVDPAEPSHGAPPAEPRAKAAASMPRT